MVQELWLFELASEKDSAAVVTSFRREFEFGPFGKYPYWPFVHGRYVVVLEVRARWHSAGRQLRSHVTKYFAKLD